MVVLTAVLLLTACSDDDGTEVETGNGEPSGATQADLVRRDWRIDAATDAEGDRRAVDPSHDAVLRFDGEGGFSGKTCNFVGGSVTIAPTALAWGDDISQTQMGCLDEDVTWLESTVNHLLSGATTWSLDEGALRIEGNDVVLELSERPAGFPTEIVQLATSDGRSEAEWQFGYTEASDAERREGAALYFLTWEGRDGPGTGYGSAGMAVDAGTSLDTMWIDDVEGQLFPFGSLPLGATSAVFETTDGDAIELHPYELPDGRLVYGEPIDATKGQVVGFDANGNEISRGRVVPAG